MPARSTSALCVATVLALLALPASAPAETCQNQEARTGPSAALPDCRAYEQVTPQFKEGAVPDLVGASIVIHGLTGVSADGSRVAVISAGNFGDANNNQQGASYELTRTLSGWTEENVDLPASLFPADNALAGTPDLSDVLLEARATSQPLDAKDLLVRAPDGSVRDLGPVYPPSSTTEPPGLGFGSVGLTGGLEGYRGASSDLSRVLFAIVGPSSSGGPSHLWPSDTTVPGYRASLYELVAGRGGPPTLVGVDGEGHQIGQCGDEADGISTDGARVLFTVLPGGCESQASGPPVHELFARIDEARTVALSEPSPTDCAACDTDPEALADASFDDASADGSKVFFTTPQPLLGTDTSANLYEYDFDAPASSPGDPNGRIVQVTGGDWGAHGAQVQGVLGVSADGSHAYFVAQGALGGAGNEQGQTPIAGGENLYVFERDASTPDGRVSFVATLSPSDSRQWLTRAERPTVTPDGRFLAFTSHAELTADDTSTARQVFRYDAQTGDLVRVSIGQDGFNQNGNTSVFDAEIPARSQDRPAMSDDGAYVAFQSADGLTPQALDGRLEKFKGLGALQSYYANNVYEYHGGNVYLISDGQDATQTGEGSAVQLDGISPSGHDLFFETADRLVAEDADTQLDVYDARIDGGFPAPVSLLPACSGDACQGELSASPVLLSPGSEFQAGEGPPAVSSAPATKAKVKAGLKAKSKRCGRASSRKRRKCVRDKAKKPTSRSKVRR